MLNSGQCAAEDLCFSLQVQRTTISIVEPIGYWSEDDLVFRDNGQFFWHSRRLVQDFLLWRLITRILISSLRRENEVGVRGGRVTLECLTTSKSVILYK